MKTPKEPNYLKKHGRKFWRGVLSDYEITECHDLRLLAEASACIDRISAAREEIEKTAVISKMAGISPSRIPLIR
jgi:hypothetical protein